ncbi:hypothetical protein L6164_026816 [Bauhinia variegata]|uniref:Uncharacterized protein n=1 Tax=Bauhinia variegata TaxID=167791 RepID=A0ACB9LRH3_BAUVA|nr:hypothetical protein L6164_026816 [Bauhinia variegata]
MGNKTSPSPSPSTIPLFLSSLLFLLLSTKAQAKDDQPYYCYSSCGSLQDIRYPFRLRGQPLSCGDPDYTLTCENQKPILEFGDGKYYVKSINYENQTIQLVDVNLANGSCNLPSGTVDLFHTDIRYQRYFPHTEISFVNCSKPINDSTFKRVPCMSGNESIIYAVYSGASVYDYQKSCSFPISTSLIDDDYGSKQPSSYEDIHKLLQNGFKLGWSVECRDCALSGLECGYNDSDPKPHYSCYKPYNEYDEVIHAYIILSIIIVSGLFFLVILVCLVIRCIVKRRARKNGEKFYQSLNLKRYTYNDITSVTNNFADKLGKGTFGSVYKGKLADGDLVAVKMLEKCKISEKDFQNEIAKICGTSHPNLIKLVGVCSDVSKRALVYEFMPNGSLDEYLLTKGETKSSSLDQLQEIALGAAKGIHHLHTATDPCILHLDIKPKNILLDQNFIPKVSDFGLRKIYAKDYNFVAMNSAKYIAPELKLNYAAATTESDVYSFGLTLLEMVGKVKNSDSGSSTEAYSISGIYENLSKGEDLEVGNLTEGEGRIARKLSMTGLWCIQVNPSERPSMSKVVEMLEHGTDDFPSAP